MMAVKAPTAKIIIVGDSGVGKSNILMRYTDDAFNFKTTSTIGIDCKAKMVDVDGKPLNLYIIDTAGQ